MPQDTGPFTPAGATHRLVDVPGGRIHLVEQGTGPLALLVHGFPELRHSRRHRLPALAAAGYRAVALGVRGYGRSSAPDDAGAYRIGAHVEDNVAVVRALGEENAVVVGHDRGSTIAAGSAAQARRVHRRRDVRCAVRAPGRHAAVRRLRHDRRERGVLRPLLPGAGPGEAEIEQDVRGWPAGFYATLSAGTGPAPGEGPVFFVPEGGRLRDRFVPARPSWLTDGELEFCAAEFERTGLTGALNRYRNMDRDREDLAAFDGAPLTQPSLFVAGALDAPLSRLADAVEAFPVTPPGPVSSHPVEDCGHWVQQERPDEVNRILTDWPASLHAPTPPAIAPPGAGTSGRPANSPMRRRVTLGASSPSPAATTRIASMMSSRAMSLTRNPAAPARSAP